ncbi:putative membrane protein [Peribacillus deserti]|uniref:Membrane protein n=1 Tax=Peribacillus deserti TaxID=673318 RepID=A0ABS2QD56_9BACI|nr:putative membrane protein [Peribacillus deserti]
MSISEIKNEAKRSLNGKWGAAVLVTFIFFLFNTLLSFFGEILIAGGLNEWWNQEQTPIEANLFNIILSIILLPLSTAFYWVFLHVSRHESIKVSQLFTIYSNGKWVLKIIGASILIAIFLVLWSLLLIIPGIIKSFSYSQTFFILRDRPELSILEAITESKKLMKGYKWKFFLMNLSFIGWAILCIFTLGIGLLWLAPYVTTSMAVFYNYLIDHYQDHADKEAII